MEDFCCHPKPGCSDDLFSQSTSNQELIAQVYDRHAAYVANPVSLYPWLLAPCTVRVLLVTDGGLDFSQGNFGLSTFVDTLINDGLFYVRFQITVAHLSEYVSDAAVMVGAPGISRSIKGFLFDNATHFTPTMYDVVFMFGIETNFQNGFYQARGANPGTYPSDRLSNQELISLSTFQNTGGGLFATGDHGQLGRSLCGAVNRARSMRYWDHTSPDPNLDEVSMSGPRRNDTNQIGNDAGTQFDDQSDDVPQTIQPRLYRYRLSPFHRTFYPHPLLCGPCGIIRVLPDHPHEGETIVPSTLTNVFTYDGSQEYPFATGAMYRVSPEIIAWSTVPAGNTADFKSPTQLHTFGAICAYDGQAAGIGRVVTDATWHHFVNINLLGDENYPDTEIKGLGFLASRRGMRHLRDIKAYYRNIALWLAPAGLQGCFRKRLCWKLLYHDRVMEAVMANPNVTTASLSASLAYDIGVHARKVLSGLIRPCFVHRFLLDILYPAVPGFAHLLDPWTTDPRPGLTGVMQWVDPTPLFDYALGGALVALRESYPYASPQRANDLENDSDAVIIQGAYQGVELALGSLGNDISTYSGVVTVAIDDLNKVKS